MLDLPHRSSPPREKNFRGLRLPTVGGTPFNSAHEDLVPCRCPPHRVHTRATTTIGTALLGPSHPRFRATLHQVGKFKFSFPARYRSTHERFFSHVKCQPSKDDQRNIARSSHENSGSLQIRTFTSALYPKPEAAVNLGKCANEPHFYSRNFTQVNWN